ncbi:hypothetical protein VIGAN_05172400 [Vigna angularis var. angularis]|uniref:Uncharacterized protein n=1 Tax=Vigna angularis var. angularis TaxID=157739 RepID=A0A0S3S613_PHAAN|nr:hypothetical protein VIGAN_05172400 [Vigna angularis var. angularis]
MFLIFSSPKFPASLLRLHLCSDFLVSSLHSSHQFFKPNLFSPFLVPYSSDLIVPPFPASPSSYSWNSSAWSSVA